MKRSTEHYFGGLFLPREAAPHHTLILGKSGAGKSLTLSMLMGTVLADISLVQDLRAVILDVKQDTLSALSGMGVPDDRVVILNPFDSRCSAWDMAKDLISPEGALQLATILIPPEESSNNRYFSDSARDLLCGLIEIFIEKAPGRWNFADLIYGMRNENRLRHVLSQTPDGQELIDLHLGIGNSSKSIISSARAFLAPFQVIAAMWSHAWRSGRRVSLDAFMRQNQVLVLGNNQAAVAAIQAINRVIFQRLTEINLDQANSETRRCWFFMDEIQKLGKLDGLVDLMIAGRSKGTCMVLGLQAVEGLRSVYGEELAEVILSMVGSIGVLKVSGIQTPRWVSEVFGDQEIRESTRSVSEATTSGASASHTVTETINETIRERRLYLPSQFQMIPLAERGKPLHGYFRSDFLDSEPYYAEIPPDQVSKYLHPPNTGRLDYVPWPDNSFKKLPAWGPEDYERLGIPLPVVYPSAPEEEDLDRFKDPNNP